jgi:hypothetical protein
MQRALRIACPLLFLFAACCAIWLSIAKPLHNWDVIPYIAAAKAFEEPDVASLQRFTYAELRRVLPAPLYEDMAREQDVGPGRGGPYRHAASTDPAVFAEILPSYRIRPLYNGAVYLLYKAGVDIEFATHFAPAVALAAGFGFLYLAARRRVAAPLACLLVPLALLFGVFDLARFSTPDGFAFCAWTLCIWLYLDERRTALWIALPAILAIRTDLILFTLPLYVALFMRDHAHWRATLVSVAATLAVHFGIIDYWKHPGWKSMFACSLVTEFRCVHPATQAPGLTLPQYTGALADGAMKLLVDVDFVLYLVLLVAGICLLRMSGAARTGASTQARTLILVCVAYIVTRFLGMPAEWERFFPAAYLMSAFGVLWLASVRWFAISQPSARESSSTHVWRNAA